MHTGEVSNVASHTVCSHSMHHRITVENVTVPEFLVRNRKSHIIPCPSSKNNE